MGKPRYILLLLAVALLALALYAILAPEPEPLYDGRKLSEWVVQYGRGCLLESDGHGVPLSPQGKRAAEAIRKIGAKSIPYLLKWMSYQPAASQQEIYAQLTKVAEKLESRKMLELLYKDQFRAIGAINAFRIAGFDARPALPDLTRMMTDTNNPEMATRADVALAFIGEMGLSTLTSALTNENAVVRAQVIDAISYLGTNACSAVPALITALKDPDPAVRQAATNALRIFTPEVLTNAPPRSRLRAFASLR